MAIDQRPPCIIWAALSGRLRRASVVKHLTKVGYADYGRFLHDEPHWVWLSGRGMRLSGTGFAYLRPKIGAMARMRAVNEVRLHL